MGDLILSFLLVSNEAITATAVIIAASLVLYNLSHNLRDRVVRASSVVLSCITLVYIGGVFLALGANNPFSHVGAWLRFQWIGIAFMPAALFHLSDTLLETTGLASRGRRKRVVRILYAYSTVFLFVAVFTDLIAYGLVRESGGVLPPTQLPGPYLSLFVFYFLVVVGFSFRNVLRARRRCLTSVTYRRMTYLLLSFLMPALGIFPYTLVLPRVPELAVGTLLLVNLANVAVALMLAFMAYPLAFFGQNRPDRVIKSELLRFFLRGPVTGIAVLLVILFLPGARVLGLPGPEFLPFVTVAAVLVVQWGIAVALPTLDRWLVYGKDQEDALQIRDLTEHMLTKADARQLLETLLAAICDLLRTPSAFVLSEEGEGPRIERAVGSLTPSKEWLASPELAALLADTTALPADAQQQNGLIVWQSYWLTPLFSDRTPPANGASNGHTPPRVIGLLGVWARSAHVNLAPDEEAVFGALCRRAARVLEDTRFQDEVIGVLQGLLPEIDAVQQLSGPARHGGAVALANAGLEIIRQPEFADLIRDALRDYWGGPRLTESRLLQLNAVRRAVRENDGNAARGVRAILGKAIESLKPEGAPNLSNEWLLYNVLDMRFVQGRKTLEVADKLAMSEANLFRKQRVAIDQVTQRIAEMERETAR